MSVVVLSRAFILALQNAQAAEPVAENAEIKTIVSRAEKVKKEGQYLDAVSIYYNGLKRFGNSAALWIGLSRTHTFFGYFNPALAAINKALMLNPNAPEALFIKGRLLTLCCNTENAMKYLKQALQNLKSSPQSESTKNQLRVKIYINLGYCHFLLGDLDSAITCTQQALTINRNSCSARNNLATYYLKRSEGESSQWYQKAVEIFKTIDPADYLAEKSSGEYSALRALQLGKELSEKIRSASHKKSNHPASDPVKVYKFAKEAILGYSRDRVPEAVGAYWQNFIRYVPDPQDEGVDALQYKDPRILAADAYGDCDDMIPFANDIFNSAGIEYKNIEYKVMSNAIHVICAFKNERGTWDYIDSDGLRRVGAISLPELLRYVKVSPIDNEVHTFIIKNNKAVKTSSFSIY